MLHVEGLKAYLQMSGGEPGQTCSLKTSLIHPTGKESDSHALSDIRWGDSPVQDGIVNLKRVAIEFEHDGLCEFRFVMNDDPMGSLFLPVYWVEQ